MSVLKGKNINGEDVYADAAGSREVWKDGVLCGSIVCAPDDFDPLSQGFHNRRYQTVSEFAQLIAGGEAVVLSDADFNSLAGELPGNVASIANPKQVGTRDCWLVGTKEELIRAEPEAMARIRCEMLAATMAARYPEAGISWGYIGNLGGTDDRGWYFFTDIVDHNDLLAGGRRSNLGGEGAATLPELADRAEKHLERWLRTRLGLPVDAAGLDVLDTGSDTQASPSPR